MRISLVVVFITFIFLNANGQQKPGSDSKRNIGPLKKTTLDSLQGQWFSKDDKKDKLKIMNDTVINIYDNEVIDTAIGYINDKCSDNIHELDKHKKSGKFLITYSEDFICYEIESISPDKLVLFYEGNALIYIRGK